MPHSQSAGFGGGTDFSSYKGTKHLLNARKAMFRHGCCPHCARLDQSMMQTIPRRHLSSGLYAREPRCAEQGTFMLNVLIELPLFVYLQTYVMLS